MEKLFFSILFNFIVFNKIMWIKRGDCGMRNFFYLIHLFCFINENI